MFIQRMLIFIVGVFIFASISSYSQGAREWRDPSPHRVLFVTVEDGVQLEVLDWGGSGKSAVLLAGIPDTAHAFDDFGPVLKRIFHVYGVTRRGFGGSSVPASGYDFPRLAMDVIRVIDELDLDRPVIVGHSAAGEEMNILGARYMGKIAGLVYLDAAFNRADRSEDYDSMARTLPRAPNPQAVDLASVSALRAFQKRVWGTAQPVAQIRGRYTINGDGSLSPDPGPPPVVRQAITKVMQQTATAYNPEPIRIPAVALYAVPKSVSDLMRPWYNANDPAIQDNVAKLLVLARESCARHAQWFQKLASGSRVAEIAGDHYLFLSNPDEVLREIDIFMSTLK